MALTSFILGIHPELSLAELRAVLKDSVKFVAIGREAVVVDMPGGAGSGFAGEPDLAVLQKQLGGTIKIGQVHVTQGFDYSLIVKTIHQVLGEGTDRAHFGISIYDAGVGTAPTIKMRQSLRRIGIQVKQDLKEWYARVRWAVSNEPVLSSVAVVKNKLLLPDGVEIQILGSKGRGAETSTWYVGHTVTVQPFEEYGTRDFGRPSRDARSGMIPPKLAQMMINLVEVKPGAVILDPFCGSGTILQEALLLGYKVIGSDLSEKAVTDSEKNLQWLTATGDTHPLPLPSRAGKDHVAPSRGEIKRGWSIEQHDVRNLSDWIKPGQVGAIVTEPYLGPQQVSAFVSKSSDQVNKVNQVIQELSDLYIKSFEQFAKILQHGQKVVMVWPVFQGKFFLSIDKQVTQLGFSLLNKRGSLMYGREGQRVQREVVVWQKND